MFCKLIRIEDGHEIEQMSSGPP